MADATPGPDVSVHLRALATWLVIFPEVTLVNMVLSPTARFGDVVGRSALVTVIVIPPAVYLFVPFLLRVAATFRPRSASGSRPSTSHTPKDAMDES